MYRKIRYYKSIVPFIIGTNFREVRRNTIIYYNKIKGNSKRKPYIRSAYFNKEKIFLELFWSHVFEKKNYWDKVRRLRLFPSAMELIKNSRFEPISKENPNRRGEILHRFGGKTLQNIVFYVQIKEEKSSGRKWLISIFPVDKR